MIAARDLPRDPALPQLARLFDGASIAGALQRVLGAALVVEECAIERVKYRPRRACVVAYKLRARDGAGVAADRRYSLCMYGAEDARARYLKARAQPAMTESATAPVYLLEELNTLAWVFPHDRKLSALPQLIDGARIAADDLPQLARERWGQEAVLREHECTVISYFPEHTCTLNYQSILSTVSGVAQRWSVFAKTRYDDAGAETYRNMRALWGSPAHRQGALGYARPLAYDSERRLLWQEGIAAPTLDSLIAGADTPLLRRAGRAIAALHATPLTSGRELRGADLVANLQRAQQAVELTLGDTPDLVTACAELAGELQRAWPRVDCSANATLHGDLHSKNMLVTQAHIALIDLDRLRRGPALAELGGVLAELIYRDCLAQRSVDYERLRVIVDAYRACVPWRVEDEQLAWHTAAALLHERIYRAITSLKPGRMQALPPVLQAARELLRGAVSFSGAAAESASIMAVPA